MEIKQKQKNINVIYYQQPASLDNLINHLKRLWLKIEMGRSKQELHKAINSCIDLINIIKEQK